jgi:ribose transport system substrate-binding protein
MKRLKFIVFVLAAVIVCLTAPACNRNSGGKRVIAVIPKGVAHFFWQSVHAGAEAAAKEFGVEVMWKGPAQETDYSGQINIVEDAINRRVDGIVLAPSHGSAGSNRRTRAEGKAFGRRL